MTHFAVYQKLIQHYYSTMLQYKIQIKKKKRNHLSSSCRDDECNLELSIFESLRYIQMVMNYVGLRV